MDEGDGVRNRKTDKGQVSERNGTGEPRRGRRRRTEGHDGVKLKRGPRGRKPSVQTGVKSPNRELWDVREQNEFTVVPG